jgi:hypothetical protein
MSSFATADYGVAVTPHDTNPLPDGRCRALRVGTGGTITLISRADKTAVPYPNIPDGGTLSVSAYIVLATGTTATGIVALY